MNTTQTWSATEQVIVECQLPTFCAHESDVVGQTYLPILKELGYDTRTIKHGQETLPWEVALIGESTTADHFSGWCQGYYQIAVHKFSPENIPDWVKGPFLVKVRLNERGFVPKRTVRSIATAYSKTFRTRGEVLPFGTPVKVSNPALKEWMERVHRALEKCPKVFGPQ